MTNRGNFAQLIAPAMMKIIFETLSDHSEEYSQFLEVLPSESAYEEDQVVAGLGLARLKQEGEPVTYDDPIEGGTKRYIHQAYALAWQITKEMIDDDKFGVMRKIPAELGKSIRHTVEQIGANVLNLAFSTVTTSDGISLLNTSHALLGGGTYGNRLNPDSDMTLTALQDILIIYENMINERRLKVRASPSKLWFPPDLQFQAAKLLQSQLEPFTGENQINVMQGRLEPAVLHYLSSTTGWFVSGDNTEGGPKLYWRTRPEVESADDFETKGTKHSIYIRLSAGATEWRNWAGSEPA